MKIFGRGLERIPDGAACSDVGSESGRDNRKDLK